MNYENTGTQNRHLAQENNKRHLALIESTCSKEALERFKTIPYQLKYQQMVKERNDHAKN